VTTPDTEPTADTAPPPAPATFRAPLVSLVAVVFLALSLSPIAFQGGAWFALMLIPVAIAWWILRTRTVVDADGLHVRTAWGSTHWEWSRVSTLRLVDRRWVRAVGTDEAELVLRGVRVRDLGRVGEASGGRIRVPSPAEAQAAEEHRLDGRGPVLVGGVHDGPGCGTADGDQGPVEPSVRRPGGVHQRLRRPGVGVVRHEAGRVRGAELPDRLLDGVGVPAREHDPRAVGDQRRGGRQSEAARAARDDVHLSLQT
jgi:hypothetical protein